MKPKERRYRIVCEVYEDDVLTRRMEENRKHSTEDYCDGENTMGMLLSFVHGWMAAETGCTGLATLAYTGFYVSQSGEDFDPWRELGNAYDQWEGTHGFGSCVKVVVDSDRLTCQDDSECSH